MVKQKDYDSLLDAMEQLGTSTFTLLIVGGGPMETKLRARCSGGPPSWTQACLASMPKARRSGARMNNR